MSFKQHIDEAAKLYREGKSMREVGERFGVHAETVRLCFKDLGVPRRRPGGDFSHMRKKRA